jgi:pSer/pThr/pTyr-binding forkhead associated (FHA) protein
MSDYVLEIVEGPEAGRRIPLTGPIEIGRDGSAGAALSMDELVSRRHVRITPEADGAKVEDLGSQNGTFVDGDEISGPAHLAVDGQVLIGVTVLQLRTASALASRGTGVRPIPADLSSLRPLPSAEPAGATAVRQVVPGLVREEAEPDYVPAEALGGAPGSGSLLPLLDVHTKGKARAAPIGIFVLVALAVILYLGWNSRSDSEGLSDAQIAYVQV